MKRVDSGRGGLSSYTDDDSSQPPADPLEPNSTEPTEADLHSFPPTLRVIYQLLRCLMGTTGCAGVSYVSTGESDKDAPTMYEGRAPRDPVVLRHILESLNFLVRVGNALQNILNAATRAAEIAAATSSASGQACPTGPGTRTARPSGGQASAGVGASVATLGVQAAFVLYLVENCLIPA